MNNYIPKQDLKKLNGEACIVYFIMEDESHGTKFSSGECS
jgi:hypothetical protein